VFERGTRIKLTILGIFVVGIYLMLFSRNKEEISYKPDVKDTLSLININKIILSMAPKVEEKTTINNIPDEPKEVIVVEEIEEEKREEKMEEKDVATNEKNPPAPSRGTNIGDSRTKSEDLSNHLNNYVLDVLKTYSLGNESYPYLLNNDYQNYNGVTEDLYYQGELLLKSHPSGNKASHCTGITFEVFFKAMMERNKALGLTIDDFNGMNKDELMDFALTWYVAKGPKSESNLAAAIEKYGLGTRITNLEDLRPGDFIDFTRENNIGHAVVFINWIREGDKIIGLKYWSSQGSTKGISYKEEYFNVLGKNGQKYGNVMIDSLHMARVNPVSQYVKR